ncbi:MAG: SEC-C metal-binding domain-containing protein, partial [Syntrophorhabdales bacterium]
MAALWSTERLISLCNHGDAGVRSWAADRLAVLFPDEAAPVMARLLGDADESVVIEAVGYFADHPEKGYADELLAVLKTSSGRVAGRLSNAVALRGDTRLLDVVREKYARETEDDMVGFTLALVGVALLRTPLSQEYVEGSLPRLLSLPLKESFAGSFFAANLVAGTDLKKLLLFCGQDGTQEMLPSLLFQVLLRCGSWISEEDLTEKPAKGSGPKALPFLVQDSLERLEKRGYARQSLASLFEKRRYDEVVRESQKTCTAVLDAKRLVSGEEEMRRWEEKGEMPFLHVSFLSALDATLDEMPKGTKEAIARSAVAALAGFVELRSLIGVNPEKLDKEAALGLLIEDRPSAPQDGRIMEVLAAGGQAGTLIDFCKRHLEEHAQSDAAPRIVDFLSWFMDEKLARDLLDLDLTDESLDEAVLLAVGKLGDRAIPLLRPIFDNGDHERIPFALEIVEDLPCEESVDIILSHWPVLWEEHQEWLLDAVESLADRRFVPLLKKELKEGEPEQGEVFRLLCLINDITDPELKRIEREARERRRQEEKVAEAIESGDVDALLSEPLDVALTCRACNGLFHYSISKVQVGMDTQDVVIADPIVCKKCGALDHYEAGDDLTLAVAARLALLDALPDDAVPDFDSMAVVPVRTRSALGEGLSCRELLAKYEKKLAKEPENAELLLGYANLLRQTKRAEDAVPFYERALERDPLAVEALGCLGDYAFFKGDFETAFARYGGAVEIMHKGHYYRVTADVDQFREAILDRLAEAAKRLGKSMPLPGDPGAQFGQAASRQKVGRNDPCPCGSGKKYKKCCLLKEPTPESHEPRQPVVDSIYLGLQKKLDDYGRHAATREDFLRASAVHWDTEPKEPLVLPEHAAEDQGDFHEWFITDFRLGRGKTVIESFLEERGSRLTEKERTLAEALSESYRSIYEVQEIREGSGLTIRDLFTGEELDVQEVSGSYSMAQWDVVHIRVYTAEGVHKFAGNGRILPRRYVNDLTAYLNDAYRAHKDELGGAPFSVFLKETPFLVGRFFDSLAEERPVFLTEERHRVISSRAHFSVANYDRARNVLLRQYDFGDAEEVRPRGIRLSWLKRGASKAWEAGTEELENAIVTTSNMVHPSGRLDWTVLGTVVLHPDRLTLECMSRERLERGEKRLEQLIGGFILLRIQSG